MHVESRPQAEHDSRRIVDSTPISPVCAGLLSTGPAVWLWLEDGGVPLAEPFAAFGERCAVGSARGGAPRSENEQT